MPTDEAGADEAKPREIGGTVEAPAVSQPRAAVVASIRAQIIGPSSQEKRRLDLEERKLFADTTRVAFVSYLQTRNGFADDIWELYVKSEEFHTGLDSPQIRKRADAHPSQLEPLRNCQDSGNDGA